MRLDMIWADRHVFIFKAIMWDVNGTSKCHVVLIWSPSSRYTRLQKRILACLSYSLCIHICQATHTKKKRWSLLVLCNWFGIMILWASLASRRMMEPNSIVHVWPRSLPLYCRRPSFEATSFWYSLEATEWLGAMQWSAGSRCSEQLIHILSILSEYLWVTWASMKAPQYDQNVFQVRIFIIVSALHSCSYCYLWRSVISS